MIQRKKLSRLPAANLFGVLVLATAQCARPPLPSGAPRSPLSAGPFFADPRGARLRPYYDDLRIPGTDDFFDAAWLPDGRRAVVLDAAQVTVWETDSGRLIGRLGTDPRRALTAMAVHPDGDLVAVAAVYEGGTAVRVWSMATNAPVTQWTVPDRVFGMTWRPDGGQLALRHGRFRDSRPTNITVLSLRAGDRLRPAFSSVYSEGVEAIAYSPDSAHLAVCRWASGDTVLVDTHSLAERSVRGRFPPKTAPFNRDGRLLLTRSEDDTARVWRTDTLVPVAGTAAIPAAAATVAWAPEDDRLAVITRDHAILVIDPAGGDRFELPLERVGTLSALTWRPDGQRLIALDSRGSIIVYDTLRKTISNRIDADFRFGGKATWRPDGRYLLLTDRGLAPRVWDMVRGEPGSVLGGYGDHRVKYPDVFWPDIEGALALVMPTGKREKRIIQIDPVSGEVLARYPEGATGFNRVLHSADGRYLAGIAPGGRWTAIAPGGEAPSVTFSLKGRMANLAAAWSPDGAHLAVHTADCGLHVIETATGRFQRQEVICDARREDSGRSPVAPVFSPDGARMAVLDRRGGLLLYETAGWRQTLAVAPDEDRRWGSRSRMAWHPKGARLVIAADDGKLWLLDGRTLAPIAIVDDSDIRGLRFSPDGDRLAVISASEAALILSSADGTVIARLPGSAYRGDCDDILHWRTDGGLVLPGPDGAMSLWTPDGEIGEWPSKDARLEITDLAFHPTADQVVCSSCYRRGENAELRSGTDAPVRLPWPFRGFGPHGRHLMGAHRNGVHLIRLASLIGDRAARPAEALTVSIIPVSPTEDAAVVFTPDGRFGGDVRGSDALRFRLGRGLVSADRAVTARAIARTHYSATLLKDFINGDLAFNEDAPKLEVGLPPKVRFVSVPGETALGGRVKVAVLAEDTGGGIRAVTLRLNGEAVAAVSRRFYPNAQTPTGILADAELTLAPGKNLIQAFAVSGAGWVVSRPFETEVFPPQP